MKHTTAGPAFGGIRQRTAEQAWTQRLQRAFLLLILPFFLVLAGCGGGSDDSPSPTPPEPVPPPVAQAKTTLLVYMLATDLESGDGSATGNLDEMMKIGSSADVNVIIQLGGADKDGWRTNQRVRVQKGGIDKLTDLGTLNMTAGETLRDFIVWGTQAYPAQQYKLVFWNHGGGPNGGVGPDEVYQALDPSVPYTMSLEVISQALAQARAQTGKSFELIGFDACLMASVEIAQALSPYARYLVASQDIEPGPGWDWTELLAHLKAKPLSTGFETGRVIANSYIAKMETQADDTLAVLSVTDLSRITPLSQAIADVAEIINRNVQSGDVAQQLNDWSDLATLRRDSLDFYSSRLFPSSMDLVDIGSFFGHFQWEPLLQVPQARLDAIQQALSQAVVYQKTGARINGTSGLTMFFPAVSFEAASTYVTLRDVPQATRALVNWFTQVATSPGLLPVLRLAQPQLHDQGRLIQTSMQEGRQAAVTFAALRGSRGWIYALKPQDAAPINPGDEVTIAAKVDTDWFHINGNLVIMVPDEHALAVGSGVYTVPVYKVNERMADDDPKKYSLGQLLIQLDGDTLENVSYKAVGFVVADSSIGSRSAALTPSDVFAPAVLSEKGDFYSSSDRIRSLDAQAPQFIVTKNAIDPAHQRNVVLGALDFGGHYHFTQRLP